MSATKRDAFSRVMAFRDVRWGNAIDQKLNVFDVISLSEHDDLRR